MVFVLLVWKVEVFCGCGSVVGWFYEVIWWIVWDVW